MHELNGSLYISVPPTAVLARLCSSTTGLLQAMWDPHCADLLSSRISSAGLPPAWCPWKWRPQGNVLLGRSHLQWCCARWRCLGLQLKGEKEIYLPWGACPCWRFCLMKMCVSQTASQTSRAPGCHSALHSGRGYPEHLPVHKAHVQMCWMCWGAPFRTTCLQCREFP